MDDAWDLAPIIVADETRATAIAAALSRSQPINLTTPPASSYTEDVRRDWHQHGHTADPFSLDDEATCIFERLGQRVRAAIMMQDGIGVIDRPLRSRHGYKHASTPFKTSLQTHDLRPGRLCGMGDLLVHSQNHYPGLSDRAVELLAATLFQTEKLCEAAKRSDRDDLKTHAQRLQRLASLLAGEA